MNGVELDRPEAYTDPQSVTMSAWALGPCTGTPIRELIGSLRLCGSNERAAEVDVAS